MSDDDLAVYTGYSPGGYGPNDSTPWMCTPQSTDSVRLSPDGQHVECNGRGAHSWNTGTPCHWDTCPKLGVQGAPVRALQSFEKNNCGPGVDCKIDQGLYDYLIKSKPFLENWGYVESRCRSDPTGTRCKAALTEVSTHPHHTREDPHLLKYCMLNFGSCDDYMKDYCSKNPTDPKCACIKSPLLHYKYNPLCTDQSCIQGGYQTQSMSSAAKGGCEIVDCSTYLSASANKNINFSDVNIQQRCGSQATQTSDVKGTSPSTLHKLIPIVIGVIIAIMIIAFLIAFVF